MAAFDYAKAQETALRLMRQFGVAARLAKTASTYDPVTGATTVNNVTPTDCVVVNLPATSGTIEAFDNSFREDLRKGKARFFYMAAKGLAFEPEAGHLLTYDGQVWELAGATPLNPNGTPLIYTMGVRPSNFDSALLTAGDFSDDFNSDFLNPATA